MSFTKQQTSQPNPATHALFRNLDWSTSLLGPVEAWPTELRTLVDLMLNSQAPQHIVWGSQYCLLYNDGYIPVLGERHPQAFGARFDEVFSDIWDGVEPIVLRTYAGESSYFENHPWTLDRGDRKEDIWITFSYTPIRGALGEVLGFHCSFHETTRAVQAERRTLEEVERLRSMFYEAPGFMALLSGADHVFELANDAYAELVGQRELIGRPVRQALPEVVSQGFVELLDEVYASGEPFVGRRMAVQLNRTDRDDVETRYVDFVFQPLRDVAGAVARIFIQGSDVTDQVRAEEELREIGASMAAAAQSAEEDRARLQALLEAAPVGIGYAGPDGRLVLVNQANFDLWGHFSLDRTVEEYSYWKAWWADGSERHGRPLEPHDWGLARALTGEAVQGDVIEIEPFDAPGTRKTVLLRASPVRNAAGEITGGVVAQIDITERVAAQRKLQESEARFRTITDAMPQMVWSARADGHSDFFNRQWYEFTGLTEGGSDGKQWLDCLHPDDRSSALATWGRSLASGQLYEIEYRMRHRSGAYRWVLARGLPVRGGDGDIVRWMGTCTDIHEQKTTFDALTASESALRDAHRRKDEFLAMLAHELRNPLAPIRTAAQLIDLPNATLPQARKAGQVIARQVKHMAELVDDLLDVSRVTRGQIVLERQVFDIREAVRSAIEQARPLVEARAHALRTRLPSKPTFVDGDRTRLVQVIANLLNNAAKYTPPGGEVSVDARVDDAGVTVTVADTGVGIEPDLLPHVFELFTQGKRTLDRSQGGLGIGLALVKGLVDLHGGRVLASSEGSGTGSRFSVWIPTVAPDAQAAKETSASARLEAVPRRVIVVDDNQDAAQTLALLLESHGHTVSVYYSAEDALAEAPARPADTYLLDIGLPGMSGLELARELRTLHAGARVHLIALSGYGRPQDLEASRDAGFDDHLTKPVDGERLIAVMTSGVGTTSDTTPGN